MENRIQVVLERQNINTEAKHRKTYEWCPRTQEIQWCEIYFEKIKFEET